MYEISYSHIISFASLALIIIAISIISSNKKKTKTELIADSSSQPTPPITQRINPINILSLDKSLFQSRFDPIEEHFFVYTKTSIFSACTNDITIYKDGAVALYGICSGNITVHKGGGIIVYGMVVGDIIDNGGEIHLYGTHIGDFIEASKEASSC